MPIPKEYGGRGADPITAIAMMEGLGYGGSDQELLFSINAHMWTSSIPLLTYGTAGQKKKYLPGLCDGSLIGANGASEPASASDIFWMQTRVQERWQRLCSERQTNLYDQCSGRGSVHALRHP
jgi:alkylation response protein AidB-like acyl-CoA dehydrogenase